METLAAWTKPVEGQAGQNPRVLGKGSGHKAPPQSCLQLVTAAG